MKLKKLSFIIVIGLAAVIAFIGFNRSGPEAVIESGSDIRIFIATDLHYFDKSLTDFSEGFDAFAVTRDGKQLLYSEDLWLLMLDSNKYFGDFSMPTGDGYITEGTAQWISVSN